MTYFGKALSWLFKPVTIPLVWLFKHRCEFDTNKTTCTNSFCPVGKMGQPGWRQWNHEWVYSRPFPKLRLVGPPGTRG